MSRELESRNNVLPYPTKWDNWTKSRGAEQSPNAQSCCGFLNEPALTAGCKWFAVK